MAKYYTKEQIMNAMEEQNLMLDDIWGVEERLDELPTADVVEVVRCKDCENYIPLRADGRCRYLDNRYVYEDDFCSYGERKYGGENNGQS